LKQNELPQFVFQDEDCACDEDSDQDKVTA